MEMGIDVAEGEGSSSNTTLSLSHYEYDVNFGELQIQESSIKTSSLVKDTLVVADLDRDFCSSTVAEAPTESCHDSGNQFRESPQTTNVKSYYVENDPEDTEYILDYDLAFWQKMERHAEQKSKKLPRNKLLRKYSSQKSNFENENIEYRSKNCGIKVQQSPLTKEGNKTSKEVSSVAKESENEDDWITDDEVDDGDHENIELAFKKEWKEKRLPHNSKEKNFVCEICGKRYSQDGYLRLHIVREHKEHEVAKRYPYFCQHCKKLYVREKQLLQHQQQYSGPCEICGVVLKCSGLFWTHRRNHDSVCKVCNKEFSTKDSLYMHVKLKHSKKEIPCPECDRKFPFEFLKKQHLAKAHHNSELTRYKCDRCDFWAVAQGFLKIHQRRVHSSELDVFTCKKCKSTFNSKLTYKNHVATHVSKSSIACPSCDQKFTSEGELQTHTISIHGIVDKVYNEKEAISSHFNSSHVSKYLCALCNITLSDAESMSQHMHKYHDIDIDSPRDIRLEIERVHLSEIVENTVQAVGNEETNPQDLDKPIIGNFSTDFDISSESSALLVPASVVPPNVNMVEINGVQYHVIKANQQH